MSFLKDDEFFLLMDLRQVGSTRPDGGLDFDSIDLTVNHISDDDMRRLRDVGIQTTLPFDCKWGEFEPTRGAYNWRYYDEYVAKAERCGLKTLLFDATHYPDWFPDDWYVWDSNSQVHKEALSPWCTEAQEACNEFTQRLIDRYTSDRCMVASAHLRCGETVLLNEAAFYDPHARASFKQIYGSDAEPVPMDPATEDWLEQSYIDMLVNHQQVLASQPEHEIWVMLHPAIANFAGLYGNGNKWIESILLNLKTQLEPVTINHIYYTWIQWQPYWQMMTSWRARFDERVFGGAEYAEGLPITTPHAIQQGLRGQILAPCYPGIHDHVEPWMLDNIRVAQSLWASKDRWGV